MYGISCLKNIKRLLPTIPNDLMSIFASAKHTRKFLLITPETHHIRAARHHFACIQRTELCDCRIASTRYRVLYTVRWNANWWTLSLAPYWFRSASRRAPQAGQMGMLSLWLSILPSLSNETFSPMRGERGSCSSLVPKHPVPDYLRNIHRCRFVIVIPYSLGTLISSKQGKWHQHFRNDVWNKNAKNKSFSFGLQFGMSFPIFSPNESTR